MKILTFDFPIYLELCDVTNFLFITLAMILANIFSENINKVYAFVAMNKTLHS